MRCGFRTKGGEHGQVGRYVGEEQSTGSDWNRPGRTGEGEDYGTASGSARGFAQHHSQQLSRAAVCGDAQNINNAARNMRVAHSFMTGLNAPPPCARAF